MFLKLTNVLDEVSFMTFFNFSKKYPIRLGSKQVKYKIVFAVENPGSSINNILSMIDNMISMKSFFTYSSIK